MVRLDSELVTPSLDGTVAEFSDSLAEISASDPRPCGEPDEHHD